MNDIIISKLNDFVLMASHTEISIWQKRVSTFLRTAIDEKCFSEFWQHHSIHDQIGFLEGLICRLYAQSEKKQSNSQDTSKNSSVNPKSENRRVFIVHGHDNATKESVARLLEKLGLEPVILHEKPNAGRAIIEKFEEYSEEVAFAIVLLTPDDIAISNTDHNARIPRARQNVILELGYFIGKLGRNKVCALKKEGVEIPSDYHGVLYIDIDTEDAWKTKIAQELIQAKVSIKLEGILGS